MRILKQPAVLQELDSGVIKETKYCRRLEGEKSARFAQQTADPGGKEAKQP